MKYIFALALALGYIQAEAAPIPAKVNLLVCTAPSPYALSRQKVLKYWDIAQKQILQEINVSVSRVSLRVRPCNLPSDYQELYSGREFKRIMRLFAPNVLKKNVLNLAIIPGITATGSNTRGIGGVTNGVCGRGYSDNLSVAAIPALSEWGENKNILAQTAMMHELAHNLGCYHSFEMPVTMMYPDPLGWAYRHGPLHFGEACKNEVVECYQL